jgi:hypothetical protein
MLPLPEVPTPVVLTQYGKSPGAAAGRPGVCQAGGMRTYYEKIGDEILAVRYYREGEKRSIQIIPRSSYF